MTQRVQDRIRADKSTVTAEKDSIIAERQIWRSVLARLGLDMKDVAVTEDRLAMLEAIILVFKDAEQFFRRSRNELTYINNEYSNLKRRLDVEQFIQQNGVSVFSSSGEKILAEIIIDVEDIVKSIEQGA